MLDTKYENNIYICTGLDKPSAGWALYAPYNTRAPMGSEAPKVRHRGRQDRDTEDLGGDGVPLPNPLMGLGNVVCSPSKMVVITPSLLCSQHWTGNVKYIKI